MDDPYWDVICEQWSDITAEGKPTASDDAFWRAASDF
jgi:hypothetical protein